MRQLFISVAVAIVMTMSLLLILLVLGNINRDLFIMITTKVVGVILILTLASAVIIKLTGADKHHKK